MLTADDARKLREEFTNRTAGGIADRLPEILFDIETHIRSAIMFHNSSSVIILQKDNDWMNSTCVKNQVISRLEEEGYSIQQVSDFNGHNDLIIRW